MKKSILFYCILYPISKTWHDNVFHIPLCSGQFHFISFHLHSIIYVMPSHSTSFFLFHSIPYSMLPHLILSYLLQSLLHSMIFHYTPLPPFQTTPSPSHLIPLWPLHVSPRPHGNNFHISFAPTSPVSCEYIPLSNSSWVILGGSPRSVA